MHALIDFCIAYMHTDSAWGMVNMIQKSQSDSEQINNYALQLYQLCIIT